VFDTFHSSASLRFFCAIGFAWPLAMIALFLTIAWFPSDPYSAAVDLSWVNPAIVTIVAAVGSTHALLIAAPLFVRLSFKRRMAATLPMGLVLVSALITYARA
jgi:hypothetical protein